MVSEGRLARQRDPSVDTESASNSLSASSPSEQNGLSSSSDEDGDDETMEQNGSQSLDATPSRRSVKQYASSSVHASHESLSGRKQTKSDSEALNHSYSAGDTALGGAIKKRKHGTTVARSPSSGRDIPDPASSSPKQLYTNHAKRMKIDPGGTMPVVGDAVSDNLRDSSGHLPQDKSKMPPAIWHRVFCYVPPKSLASLLRVNRAFNVYLTPPLRDTTSVTATNSRNGASQPLDADTIWSMSRKLFNPEMPRPLQALSELDMWKLLHRRNCQFCGKLGSAVMDNVGENVWQSGPGEDGVKIIWQFGVCTCGSCLQEQSLKEVTLLISSSIPSSLLPALPFLFLTPDLHAITPSALQTSAPPPTLQMVKIYFKQHIEEIKHEFEEVLALGPAASEEWFKGLEGLGRERMSDALRCERWEAKSGLKDLLSKPTVQSTAAPAPVSSSSDASNVIDEPTTELANMATSTGSFQLATGYNSPMPQKEHFSPLRFAISPVDTGHGHPAPPYAKQSRGERTIQEVNERKAHRRAEIERRCLEFSPPLEPSVLNHMDAFQAALQIPTPLTDQAWEVLKPRILAQRDAAEKREKERVLQSQQYQQKFEERRQIEARVKEAKEIMDREWDDVQQPVRDLLGSYADEVIKENWKGGDLITKDNSPKFAADVLIYVRQRFYAQIAQEDAVARAAGAEPIRDHPDSPPKRKLILENMKWIFDTKIKPLTEHYRKELFLCSGCHDNFKFYGFEGVIQHYAAKHTNALSFGAIVVHWRAEWPEQHPFHPDPGSAKASFYAMASPALGAVQLPIGAPMHFQGFTQDPGIGPYMATQGVHSYSQFSPGPHGHPQYTGRQPPHSHGPYAPPQSYPNPQGLQGPANFQGTTTGFPVAPPSFQGPPPGYQGVQGFQGVPQGYQGYACQFPGQPPTTFNAPSPAPPYGQVIHAPQPAVAQGYRPKTGPYGQSLGPGVQYPQPYQQPGAPASVSSLQTVPNVIGQNSEMYQIQLEKMAAIAREIFFAMSGIKDLPGSVRISVVIHHMVWKFVTEFANEPSLAMFTDGLSNHAAMRPIRNVNGVPCKVCANALNGVSNGSNGTFHSRPRHASFGDRKPIFPLPALLNHFQTAHIERANPPIIPQGGISASRLDWKKDMIELPDISVISGLLHAQGMDDNKLNLLAKVFPKAFSDPLPRLGPASNTGPVPVKQEEGAIQASEFSSRDTSTAIDTNLSRAGSHNGSYTSLLQQPQSHVQSIVPSPTNAYPPPQRGSTSTETISNEKPREAYGRRHSSYYVPSGHEYQGTISSRYSQQGRRDGGRVLRNPGERDSERYYQHPPRNGDTEPGEYLPEERRSRPTVTPPRSDPRDRYSARYNVRPGPRTRSRSPRGHPEYVEYERRRSPDFPALRASRTGGLNEHPSLLKSPVTQMPVPEKKEVGPAGVAGEGSEDGEVDDGAAVRNEDSSNSSLADVNAAERFLEEFLPGEDAAEEYKRKAAEHDRRKEEKMKAKWLAEREAEERKKKAGDDGPDASERGYIDGTRASDIKDLRRTPVRNIVGRPTSRSGDVGSPLGGDWAPLQYDYGAAAHYERSSPQPRQRERSPELVDPRYVRPAASYRNERHPNDSTRRLRGRYDQFEAYRLERYRNRSRSPVSGRGMLEEDYYGGTAPGPRPDQLYRTRSPRPLQRQLSGDSSATLVRPYGRGYADAQAFYPAHYVHERMYVSGRADARSPDSSTLSSGRLVRQELAPAYVAVDEDYQRGRAIYAEREHARR